jgi:hypothetical protein
VDGDGVGVDGFMELMELQPAGFGVLLQRRHGGGAEKQKRLAW